MKQSNLFLLGVLLSTMKISATPQFAREYGVACSTCHTMIPTLNETGKNFLRDGFRFSQEETPTLKKLIDPKDGEKRPIPLAVMLNANYDSQSEDIQEKVKLYTGGTITNNLSFFGLTKANFNGNNDDKSDFFTQSSSRAYFQLNLKGNEHVFRTGLISPLTQFGNIEKATADSGLKGHNAQDNDQAGNNQNYNYNKYGYEDSGNGGTGGYAQDNDNGHQGGSNYKTPVQNASIGNVKGVEYSYLYNDKLMFLVSYGKSIDEGNGGDNGNENSQNENSVNTLNSGSSDDDYSFVSGVNYKTDSGYNIGFIYNKYEKNGIDNESALIPIQKQFDKFGVVSTLVYKDETALEDSYYGIENSVTYSINEESYLRGIVNLDKQDDDNNYGLSLTYSQMYKYFLFHITGARKVTEEDNENLFLGSVSFLF